MDGVRHLVVLRAGLGKKQRQAVGERLALVPRDEPRVILATGRYVGEGFDDPRLDTLFLTLPVSWRGTVAQYAGRLHRSTTASAKGESTTTQISVCRCWRGCSTGVAEVMKLSATLVCRLTCIDYLVHIGQNRHMKAQTTNTERGSGSSAVRRRRAGRDHVATFRNSRGETLEPSSVTASEAKNEFGRVLDMVIQGGAVVITKHDAPKAVLISVENFNALSGAAETKLDALTHEFDALLAQMQTVKARLGMKTAFAASAKQLGKAAVAAARSRG